jgi:mutator protein MutT
VSRVPVVAAVVQREARLLLGRRPDHKRHGGLWEFPGGKIDEGESPTEAARRELSEELAVDVLHVGERLLSVDDEASPFVIEFYPVRVSGEPKPLEHSKVGWFSVEELSTMQLAPADAEFMTWLTATRRPDNG